MFSVERSWIEFILRIPFQVSTCTTDISISVTGFFLSSFSPSSHDRQAKLPREGDTFSEACPAETSLIPCSALSFRQVARNLDCDGIEC